MGALQGATGNRATPGNRHGPSATQNTKIQQTGTQNIQNTEGILKPERKPKPQKPETPETQGLGQILVVSCTPRRMLIFMGRRFRRTIFPHASCNDPGQHCSMSCVTQTCHSQQGAGEQAQGATLSKAISREMTKAGKDKLLLACSGSAYSAAHKKAQHEGRPVPKQVMA